MFNQGEIVLIPVPFTDLSASKRRPVLIVSNNNYNAAKHDIIVAAITSNLTQAGIPITNNDMISGQIPKPSVVRSDKIYTLDQRIVVKPIGSVSKAVQEAVKMEIARLIDLI